MDALNEFVASIIHRLWIWRTPSLNKMALQPENLEENPLMIQFYTWESRGNEQTSWWKHFEQEIPRIKDLGVTHVWLPPMAKSATRNFCGYDVYDLWDLGEFDQKNSVATRWGTKEELVRACSVAKTHGVGIIVDVVLNHRCGADGKESFQAIPIEEKNRLIRKGPNREIEAWTIYNFFGRQNKLNEMEPPPLLGVVLPQLVHTAVPNNDMYLGVDWDAKTRTKEVFYIPGPGRKGWSKYVANELGNYDYLLGCDVDHRQPDVRQDFFNWGSWIVEQTGAIGFRMDAMKHYDRRFLREFLHRTKKVSGKPAFFVVSEFWSGDIDILERYVDLLRGSTSFFDVPLHYNFHNASKQGPDYDLRQILRSSLVGRRPGEAVTFVDNHDTEIGQSLESWVYPGFKLQAYALILLRMEGFPCIFYGDLYPDNECYDPRIGPKLGLLIHARKNFAYGPTTDYFQYEDCIGFVRLGDARHPGCAVVIRSSIGSGDVMSEAPISASGIPNNLPVKPKETADDVQGIRMKARASAHKKYPGAPAKFRDLLGGDSTSITVSSDGWALFPCPIGSVAVWVPEI